MLVWLIKLYNFIIFLHAHANLFPEYDWDGGSIKYHRAQIRDYMGFRECTLKDLKQLLILHF